MRYFAFLRGININGKNVVPMSKLKSVFEELGFSDVVTYLNSGNVAFSYNTASQDVLVKQISEAIWQKFQLDIPVFVLPQTELSDILDHAPEWWDSGDRSRYDNMIFMLPPLTYEELCQQLGAPNEELETVQPYKCAVFWTFDRVKYQKTNWWAKTANCAARMQITIRTANTLKKLILK